MKLDFTLTGTGDVERVQTSFQARLLHVQNMTPYTLYVREGSQDTPNPTLFDFQVPPSSAASYPVMGTLFAFALGSVVAVIGPSIALSAVAASCLVILTDGNEPAPQLTPLSLGIPSQHYDRNAAIKTMKYTGVAIAPHGETTRATYTVPDGKRAFVDVLYGDMRKSAAPGTANFASIAWIYNPSGANLLIFRVFFNMGIDPNSSGSQTGLGLLVESDVLEMHTFDGSTGGSESYNCATKLEEFDQ